PRVALRSHARATERDGAGERPHARHPQPAARRLRPRRGQGVRAALKKSLRLGLRIRLAVSASLLVIAVSLGRASLFARLASRQLSHEFESTMRSLAENFSRNAAHGVFI